MSPGLTPTGWVALGCLIAIVILSGLVLWGVWLRGRKGAVHSPPPEAGQGPSLTRNWRREEDQFGELSRKVGDLREGTEDGRQDLTTNKH